MSMQEGLSDKDKAIREVHGLSPLETALAKAYLQGCVYGWCKSKGTEPFRAQFFLGGDNYFWQSTPMFAVYAKRMIYYDGNWDAASHQAAIDAGHLLKAVIIEDKRFFRTWTGEDGFRWYQWDGDTSQDNEMRKAYNDYILSAKDSLEPHEDSFTIPEEG